MYKNKLEILLALIRYALSRKYRVFIRKQTLFGEMMRGIDKRQYELIQEGYITNLREYDEFDRLDKLGLRVCEWWEKQNGY